MERFYSLLTDLYGSESKILAAEIQKLLPEQALGNSSLSGWTTYIVYPNVFFSGSSPGSFFAQLQEQLPRIKDLGCDAIHILPLFASPGFDMGFDVADFLQPNPHYGNSDDLDALLAAAQEIGLKVILDLILNHVSIEHQWFQAALAGGDERSYFFTTRDRPTLIERSSAPGKGEYARYQLGKHDFSQRIIFPTQADPELPHWEKVPDRDWYYYHTFYPHQVDLNWGRPEVFLEFAKILIHWAKRGVSFRLDAVPFIGRDLFAGSVPDDTDGSTEKTHTIVQALRQVLLATAPDSVFLVEASESPQRVQQYLDANEAQLAYDFHATMALWAAVASEDPKFLRDRLPAPAPSGHILTPVRTHDGILLESGNPEVVRPLLDALLKPEIWPDPSTEEVWNRPHDSVYDVPGRALSLLGNEPERVLLIHFLAACLPGYPMVYYGDELGLGNNVRFMREQQRTKAEKSGSNVGFDYREINRGPVRQEDLQTELASFLSQGLAGILKNRPAICATHAPQPLQNLPDEVLGLAWEDDGAIAFAFANLKGSAVEFELPTAAVGLAPVGNSEFPSLRKQTQLQLPGYGYAWLCPDGNPPE